MSEMLNIVHVGVKVLFFTGPAKPENKLCVPKNTMVHRPSEIVLDFLITEEKKEGRNKVPCPANCEIPQGKFH